MNNSPNFLLEISSLKNIADVFRHRMQEGLATENLEIKALPTYIAVNENQPSGCAYVLDLGGSNLRASFVNLDLGTISEPLQKLMPWQRGIPLDKFNYLDQQEKRRCSVSLLNKRYFGFKNCRAVSWCKFV